MRTARSTRGLLRRVALGSLAAIPPALAIWLAAPPSAVARCCTVKSGGSPNANEISSLYNIIFYLAIFVFVTVVSFLLFSVWRFRAHKHPVAHQIHGNTKLELSLTASAALILVILATVTFIKLPKIIDAPNSNPGASAVLSASLTAPKPPNGQKLTICVNGRQFIWRYTYGANCEKAAWSDRLPYSYQEMYVPAGITVDLDITSSDVIHAWWVPALGGKVDAVPGFTVYTWFKALHAGELYHGQCAQLCGRGHAFMTALVKVLTPTQYSAWLKTQEANIQAANNQDASLRQDLINQQLLTSSGNF